MLKKQMIVAVMSVLSVFFLSCSQEMSETEIMELAKGIHERAITLYTHVDIGRNYATPEVDPGIDNPKLRCDLVKMVKGGVIQIIAMKGYLKIQPREELNKLREKYGLPGRREMRRIPAARSIE